MVTTNKKILEQFREFLLSAKKQSVLFYHSDADGLAAGVIMAKAFEKLGNAAPVSVPVEYFETDKMLAVFKKHAPTKVIFVDIAIDSKPHVVKEMEKKAKLLVVDHHKIAHNIESKRTIFIKAQMLSPIEPSNYPASKLTFDLCSAIVDLKKESWVPCVGIIGDKSTVQWKSFLKKACEESKVSVEELKLIAELVEAVKVVSPERFSELFDMFYFLAPKEILESPLNQKRVTLKKALAKLKEQFKNKAEYYPDLELYFFEMKPEFPIKSALIDSLTDKYPDKTLVIVEDIGEEKVRFSARRQDFRVKMNELLEKAVRGIPDSDAGGHVPAAAGSVPRAHL